MVCDGSGVCVCDGVNIGPDAVGAGDDAVGAGDELVKVGVGVGVIVK